MKRLLFTLTLMLLSVAIHASTLVDGIYYNLNDADKTAEVTLSPNLYSGDITIPSNITYNGISYTVTIIGESAFKDCSNLTSITVPNSVTRIDNNVFRSCFDLQSIDIPNSVTSIGDYAFFGCTALTSIEIPNSVTRIGVEAFAACYTLESISIPNSVTEIGEGMFGLCRNLASVIIPNSVTIIGDAAFLSCYNLTSINIPNSVVEIGKYAFLGCESLPVENNIRYADTYLVEVIDKSLNSYIIKEETRFIGESAFSYCNDLIDLNIPNGVIFIGEGAFLSCKSLTSIIIPNGVTSIEKETFKNCSSMTSITIPDGVTNIGESAFYGCSSVTSITIPNGVTSIEKETFEGCSSMTSITVPDGVTNIGESAFYGCSSITSINIGNSVNNIGNYAFYDCTNLTTVIIDSDNIAGKTYSGYKGLNRYFGNQVLNYVFGEHVTTIGEYAFYDNSTVRTVHFSKNINLVKSYAFQFCTGLEKVIIDDIASWCNITFSWDGDTNPLEHAKHLFIDDNTEVIDLIIPEGVTTIKNFAFTHCEGIRTISLPLSLTDIRTSAFWGCNGITSIRIPENVTKIYDGAFNDCSKLDTVFINSNSIVSKSYNSSNSLAHIFGQQVHKYSIGENVSSIGTYAFYNCTSMTAVDIPNSVTQIGKYAFAGSTVLTTVTSFIVEPFSVNCFNEQTYSRATLYVPYRSLDLYKNTEGWKSFLDIQDIDIFVKTANLSRELGKLHVCVEFSEVGGLESQLDRIVSLKSQDSQLALQGYSMEGSTAHLYFDLPRKYGVYRLRIEASEIYEENFIFDDRELYVIAQSPLTGTKGKEGHTDISFNAFVGDIPLSLISLISPSGNRADIKSVTLIENETPTRLRITYNALEEDGIYRLMIGKGLKSSDKEMYYDFESTIELPCADLELQDIVTDETGWTPGQTQTVTYTVCNKGANVAVGECVDVIYMSAYNVLDDDAVELYRDTTNVYLQSQESQTRSVDVKVPTFVDGGYYLILKTNVYENIKELSYENNANVSEKIEVTVESLNDENCNFTLKRGESRLFSIPLDTDENIKILDNYGIAEMYVSTFGLPDTYSTPQTGIATIINDGQSSTCYLLVRNNSKSVTISQQCQLNVRKFGLEISNVKRESIVRYKTAWIPIDVMGCSEIPTFYLIAPSGEKIPSMDIRYKSETEFYAKFDTQVLYPGLYNLYVESGDLSGIKEHAISIIDDSAQPNLSSNLYLPGAYRVGEPFTARIQYENTGNVDLPIPLLILSGEEGCTYMLQDEEYVYKDEIHLAGVNSGSVIGTLMPGESGSFNVIIDRGNNSSETATFFLKSITYGSDGIDEPFYLQWLDVDPEDRPDCYSEDEWVSYCTRLRKNVGDTWETFMDVFGKAADLVYTYDNVSYDADYLYSIIRSYDVDSLLASSSLQNKSKFAPGWLDDEVGTIYLYDKEGGWQKLVEPVYDESGNFLTWERTAICADLPSYIGNRYYFISHGMNNSHLEGWIWEMAFYLSNYGKVICVDWGKKSQGILPWQAASHINEVVRNTHMALNVSFNGDVNRDISLEKFHLIGHSHGSHVCGRLTRTYKNSRAYRLTSLDESEEIDHWYKEQYLRGERYNAGYVDYYKSSIICGTEYLVGDDNFILVKKDGDFKNYLYNDPKYDGERHGYAYEWFTQTINDTDVLGFNWYDKRRNHPKVTHSLGWSGVINGEKNNIENYLDFGDNDDLRYTTPWYNLKKYTKKASEWEFRKALASAFDYSVCDFEEKEYIQAGKKEKLSVQVTNGATNQSIELDDRRAETKKHACHALYITRKDSPDPQITSKNYVTHIKTGRSWYYLCNNDEYIPTDDPIDIKFSFTISNHLYESLGGEDEDEIQCDFWIVSGINSSEPYQSSPISSIVLWDGELLPRDNYKKVTLTVKKPNLSCNAGADKTYTLGKDQKTVNVKVKGEVLSGEDMDLSYQWENKGVVFSESSSGSISLGVGKHPLTFSVEENVPEGSALHSPSSISAEDDVVIIVKPYTPGDEDESDIEPLQSCDPNEKVGYNGVGVNSCVKQGEAMEYVIYFENDAEKAQLAAQKVVVTDTLDTAFDLSTFEFLGTEVANTEVVIPSGKNEITAYTDLRPVNDLILKTEMKLDLDTRVVTVTYTSLDTLTLEPTRDMFAGFLPPNDSTHVGEGHFSYRVKLKDNISDNYEVRNTAHIVFDYNDVISTNTTCHVLDNRIPISWMELLPTMTEEDSVLVSWNGRDDGSGIKYYDIYRSKNDGLYEIWLKHTPCNSAILHGEVGDKFQFYSIATDYIGFVEYDKTEAETSIMFAEKGVGVNELSLSDKNVDIYPKVIEDHVDIYVKSFRKLGKVLVNIYDLSGKRHQTNRFITDGNSLKRTIECNSLVQGVYIIEVVVNNTKWASEKVVKK